MCRHPLNTWQILKIRLFDYTNQIQKLVESKNRFSLHFIEELGFVLFWQETAMTLVDIKIGVLLERFTTIQCNLWPIMVLCIQKGNVSDTDFACVLALIFGAHLFVGYRQLDGGSHVLIAFCWGCPSGSPSYQNLRTSRTTASNYPN